MMTYSVEELIGFLKDGSITLKNISMLKNLALFSSDELMQFITSGVCTFEDMQRCGLHFKKQAELRERLQLWEIERTFWESACKTNTADSYREYQQAFPNGVKYDEASQRIIELTENEVWLAARQSNTVSLYEHYLSLYPEGRFHIEAESYLREMKDRMSSLKYELLEDMRRNAYKYTPHMMRALLKGSGNCDSKQLVNLDPLDVAAQFINLGCTVTYQELLDNQVIPPDITENDLMTTEFDLKRAKDFNDFPSGRTDIYFLGVPRSGKSSVLAGLFNAMTTRGNWRYVTNISENGLDNSKAYFNGLVRSVATKKPPVPTPDETINYINIDVPNAAGTKRTAHLNFVEISGECFRHYAYSQEDSWRREEWLKLGASKVIAPKNKKVLFFLLDYNTILGNQAGITPIDQQEALQNALDVFTSDGPDRKNPSKGCTMTKVTSVGVIITKADLMPSDDKEERLRIALDYLNSNFSNFMGELQKVCKNFGINKKDGHTPYVFTFSLGKFYPGNTLLFNHENSMELASLIERLVPTDRSWNLF